MAALRLPISLTPSFTSPARRRRLRVNSLHPLPKSIIFPPTLLPKPLPTRIFPITCYLKTTDHHHHHHHNHHNHHHHCHHHHNGDELKLTYSQLVFADFAKAVKWTDLADLLRDNLGLCCFSTALLLAATACPYMVPKAYVRPIQHVLSLVAFPLVGVIISLFALIRYVLSF